MLSLFGYSLSSELGGAGNSRSPTQSSRSNICGADSMTDKLRYEGACHCGALQFRLTTRPPHSLLRCNCSICELEDYLHWIMPLSHFEWVSGEASIYCFGSRVARHTFCPTCGIKPFYFPRSNPDGVSVNARCVRGIDWRELPVDLFDGQHWEKNALTITHLSFDR